MILSGVSVRHRGLVRASDCLVVDLPGQPLSCNVAGRSVMADHHVPAMHERFESGRQASWSDAFPSIWNHHHHLLLVGYLVGGPPRPAGLGISQPRMVETPPANTARPQPHTLQVLLDQRGRFALGMHQNTPTRAIGAQRLAPHTSTFIDVLGHDKDRPKIGGLRLSSVIVWFHPPQKGGETPRESLQHLVFWYALGTLLRTYASRINTRVTQTRPNAPPSGPCLPSHKVLLNQRQGRLWRH